MRRNVAIPHTRKGEEKGRLGRTLNAHRKQYSRDDQPKQPFHEEEQDAYDTQARYDSSRSLPTGKVIPRGRIGGCRCHRPTRKRTRAEGYIGHPAKIF